MKFNNKKFVKIIAMFYAAVALMFFSGTAICMLQRQTIAVVLFAFLTIAMSLMLWKLQYIEIEHERMFISIRKRYLLENSTQPLFEMPYAEIIQIKISHTRFGHQMIIVRRKDKGTSTLFRFFLTGMDKTEIGQLGVTIRADLPDIAYLHS